MCPCWCCYWRTANGTSALDGVVQPKRLCLAPYPISVAGKEIQIEYDRSSWLGEIMRQIKLCAKPKYEISFHYNSIKTNGKIKFNPRILPNDNFTKNSKSNENWNSSTKLKRKKKHLNSKNFVFLILSLR